MNVALPGLPDALRSDQWAQPFPLDGALHHMVQVFNGRGLMTYFPCQGRWFGVEQAFLVLEGSLAHASRSQFVDVAQDLQRTLADQPDSFNWRWELKPVFRWMPNHVEPSMTHGRARKPKVRGVSNSLYQFTAGYALSCFTPNGDWFSRVRTALFQRQCLNRDFVTMASIVSQYPRVWSVQDLAYAGALYE